MRHVGSRRSHRGGDVRLASFRLDDDETWGVHLGDRVVPASALGIAERWSTLLALVRGGDEALAELTDRLRGDLRTVPAADARLLAPIPEPPQNPVTVGLNYREHTEESLQVTGVSEGPAVPMLFTKARSAVIGPDEPIRIDPSVTKEVDWEVELTAVIGLPGRDIPVDRALQHVFGYTIGNDVSARDIQFRDQKLPQFYQGKSLDTFCPTGPWIVTRDELDAADLQVSLRVNEVVKQDGSTRQMIFDVPAIVAELSRSRRVEPGELILTGTPAGVGFTRDPPEYLEPGDIVVAEIEGIGTLRNPVELANGGLAR
jgi:2-keto-4-pentenoate hydratase/2-oxohepta-3-ene-1,7-dioic acid hydratase in catechol pathway